MSKQEIFQLHENICSIYNGILANNPMSDGAVVKAVQYELNCPQFEKLKATYGLEAIAGKGSDFVRAKRVLNYFAPRLHHNSFYDNHVECNALALLEYSFENEVQGINCLNKAKILQECLLALEIYARRAFMMPYSPFDPDNHVVVEMFDRETQKWIMLDPSTNFYMVNKELQPLSLMEIRTTFEENEPVVPVEANRKKIDFQKQREKHIEEIAYYAKNCFYFSLDEYATFGEKDGELTFAPAHFRFGRWKYKNAKFKYNYVVEHQEEIGADAAVLEWMKQSLLEAEKTIEQTRELCALSAYFAPPATERGVLQ